MSVTVMLVTVMQIYEYNYHLCNKYQRIYLLFFCLKEIKVMSFAVGSIRNVYYISSSK